MLFLKVLLGVVGALLLLTALEGSFILILRLSIATVRPALMRIWGFCFYRKIPFPNWWEGLQGLMVSSLVALIVWLTIWITIGIKLYSYLSV